MPQLEHAVSDLARWQVWNRDNFTCLCCGSRMFLEVDHVVPFARGGDNTPKQVKITVMGYRCERCKWEWIPRGETAPRVCPKCKSPYWDKPRQEK